MKLKHVAKSASALVKIYAGKTVPLKVSHYITYKCNLRCRFCDAWKNSSESEMSESQVKSLMGSFSNLGTISWSISGGEPFIRPDLPRILRHAKSLGFITSIVTNGTFPGKIKEIKDDIDLILLSVEGDEKETDYYRGKGTFSKIGKTLDEIVRYGINANLNTVIKPDNRKQLVYIISLAEKHGIFCGFQPIFDYMKGGREVEDIVKSKKKLGMLIDNIDFLISEKKRGAPILNSVSYLRYLKSYGKEKFRIMRCFAGRNTVLIEPDGTMKKCYWDSAPVPPGGDLKESLKKVTRQPKGCYCWPKCHGENNLIFSLSIDAILNARKKI